MTRTAVKHRDPNKGALQKVDHPDLNGSSEPTLDELERQLSLAAKLDGLLAKVPEASKEKPVFNLTDEDGRAIAAAEKGDSKALTVWLLESISAIVSTPTKERSATLGLSAAAAALLSSAPKNPMEALLLGQMLATHTLAMQFGTKALSSSDSAIASRLAAKAIGFLEVASRQLEVLMKLRGESVNQRVVVEHLSVGGEAQAIIGQVAGGSTRQK